MAWYVTDVKFQQSYRPMGSHDELKAYFSNKHKQYVNKCEVSLLSNGLDINCTNQYSGSTAGITIFRSNQEFKQEALRQAQGNVDSFQDFGRLDDEYLQFWAALVDSGYQDATDFIRAIHPRKEPIRGVLSAEDLRVKFQGVFR